MAVQPGQTTVLYDANGNAVQTVTGGSDVSSSSAGIQLQVPLLFDSSSDRIIYAARQLSDAISGANTPGAAILRFNGTTWDREYNNREGTLLASAARTAATTSPDQTNYNAKGVMVYLNVTVASGTGGLQVQIQIKDPVSGNYAQVNTSPTAVTATGLKTYAYYPAAVTNNLTQFTGGPLTRTWRVNVAVGDTSSYTYSLGYALLD